MLSKTISVTLSEKTHRIYLLVNTVFLFLYLPLAKWRSFYIIKARSVKL